MLSTDVQIGVAALLELCAQRRAGVISAPYQDDPVQVTRMLQAEAAGRELMAALVRSDPYPDISLGAVIRRLVGYIQKILTASTPAEEITPLLTVRTHYVTVGADAARLLRDAAILLVLAALDDGAQEVAVRLDSTPAEACLIVESDRPGTTANLPSLAALRATVAAGGGSWNASCATHGASWLVHVTIPAAGLLQESLDKEHVNGY